MEGKQSLDIVAIASAAIAFFAAIFTLWQAISAKKSYTLQKKVFEEGKVNFDIRGIENSFLLDVKTEDQIYYFFKIVLVNLSDKATSINNISLELVHDNNLSFILKCNNGISIQSELPRLSIPNNIGPHNSNSGWIVFTVDRKMYKAINIDTHFILVEDIHGITAKKEEIYVKEEFVEYDFR